MKTLFIVHVEPAMNKEFPVISRQLIHSINAIIPQYDRVIALRSWWSRGLLPPLDQNNRIEVWEWGWGYSPWFNCLKKEQLIPGVHGWTYIPDELLESNDITHADICGGRRWECVEDWGLCLKKANIDHRIIGRMTY